MVTELLHLVRPADESMTDEVDVAAVVTAAVYDLRAAHPSRNLTLATPADVSELIVIGDVARLHQAVLNLGANACHHTPDGTDVAFDVSREGDDAVGRVIDNGLGIDPATADDLLQPLTRTDESRTRQRHDGAGLGLALVRRIAEQHRGRIEVGPTPGGGATFTLRLPGSGDTSPIALL